MDRNLLQVKSLKTYFSLGGFTGKAVDGLNFSVKQGEVLGIVGESGSGKSVTALSIMKLVRPPGRIVDGSILFDGIDIAQADEKTMRKIRGKRISMIFQEPMTSLNPLFSVGDQIGEVLHEHTDLSKAEIRNRTLELLSMVSIPNPMQRIDDYPHQFSGGMRQRVMIAMALACEPDLLIADEPTTALDVTIQAQIIDLMLGLREKLKKTSIMLITHNLGIVAEICDFVLVMYAGKVVEHGPVEAIFENPRHPYTRGLLKSVPIIGVKKSRLDIVKGTVPSVFDLPEGCKFHPRCPHKKDICCADEPPLREVGQRHYIRCFFDIE